MSARLLLLLTMLLSACATATPHYYTLQRPLGATTATSGAPAAIIDRPSVRVPQAVDGRALVIRLGTGELAPMESRRWSAALPDEIAAALGDAVQRRIGASASSGSPSRYRIVVDVTRFDAWPGNRLDLAADWTLIESRADPLAPHRRWNCTSVITQSLAQGYPALVSGAQQAIDRLATPIAALIQSATASDTAPGCP